MGTERSTAGMWSGNSSRPRKWRVGVDGEVRRGGLLLPAGGDNHGIVEGAVGRGGGKGVGGLLLPAGGDILADPLQEVDDAAVDLEREHRRHRHWRIDEVWGKHDGHRFDRHTVDGLVPGDVVHQP